MGDDAQGGYIHSDGPEAPVIRMHNDYVISAEEAKLLTADWLRTSEAGGTGSASPDVAPAAW
jgi:hypothetical protein